MRQVYDVVIIGAGLAGCTAAILFARRGAQVALVERKPEMNAYKKICTHFIQASASPIIESMGLGKLIERAGGLKNYGEFWTKWGWIRESEVTRRYGYSIQRKTLDPLIRKLATETPDVDAFLGYSVRGLMKDIDRPVGIHAENAKGQSIEISARLVVGADGRNSEIARLSGVPAKITSNNRFTYFTYYRDLPFAADGASQLWLLDPDVAYACPNDDQVTMVAACITNDKFASWKSDLERSLTTLFAGLPNGLNLSAGRRVSPFLGATAMHHISRTPSLPGLALVGDAALAADPLWGVGCGWAFQSSAWLVDTTWKHLADRAALDRALRDYRRRHRSSLGPHERLISKYASGRRFNPLEKLMLCAAARDSHHASCLTRYADRTATVSEFLSPRAIIGALACNTGYWTRRRVASLAATGRERKMATDI